MTKDLAFYIRAFKKLRRGNTIYGLAPHKPILLLTVLQAYKTGHLNSNKIFITPELITSFKNNWHSLVLTTNHSRFTLPFYHLSKEKTDFWRIIFKVGKKPMDNKPIYGFKKLLASVEYAEIDQNLYEICIDRKSNTLMSSLLLKEYFPNAQIVFQSNNWSTNLSKDILEEPLEAYTSLKQLKKRAHKEEWEEYVYLRRHQFPQEVLKNYQHSCAISRLKINTPENISLLDACHIVPFSETHNDTITNGIALTPTLHRAFDRGLISISNEFKVLVNKNFSERGISPYSIKQFEGKMLLLPEFTSRLPSREGLSIHRKRFGFI